MASPAPSLIAIFARNVELLAFKRNLSRRTLASRLGVSNYVLQRILERRNRHIDPEIVEALLTFFSCTPNDLFLPQPDVNYTLDASPGGSDSISSDLSTCPRPDHQR